MILAIDFILEEVRKIIIPSTKKDLEYTIVEEIKEKSCINFELLEPVQEIINKYIESASEERLRAIYENTETGLINDDAKDATLGWIEMVLQEALLEKVVEELYYMTEV